MSIHRPESWILHASAEALKYWLILSIAKQDEPMRVVKEIPNPDCKITIFSWNEKFLIKLEKGPFEQTFKISEMDILEEELDEILNPEFVAQSLERFEGMFASLQQHMP